MRRATQPTALAVALQEPDDVRRAMVRGIQLACERFYWMGGASESDTFTREDIRKGMLQLAATIADGAAKEPGKP